MSKKILITGITGMVGSHLADFVMENTDWEIYGMCRWRSPLDNIEHLIDDINNTFGICGFARYNRSRPSI